MILPVNSFNCHKPSVLPQKHTYYTAKLAEKNTKNGVGGLILPSTSGLLALCAFDYFIDKGIMTDTNVRTNKDLIKMTRKIERIHKELGKDLIFLDDFEKTIKDTTMEPLETVAEKGIKRIAKAVK